jgi:hypothetical protein
MATKTAKRKVIKTINKMVPEQMEKIIPEVNMQPTPVIRKFRFGKKWLIGAVIVAGVAVFWYKTNTWPIAAVVGISPITRFQVDQELYKQNGKAMLDNIITQKLVENELANKKVNVSEQEVNDQLDSIKKNMGPDMTDQKFNELLASRGLTLEEVKKQIRMQLEIEKLLSGQATVSAEEVDKYVKENSQYLTGSSEAEKKVEAQSILKQQKLQSVIQTWVDGLRNQAKIWIVGSK